VISFILKIDRLIMSPIKGTWVWLADHDLDASSQAQISIFSGRGILSESAGPVWMIGTGEFFLLFGNSPLNISAASEHHVLYQYNLVNAASHYLGLIQTETVSSVPKIFWQIIIILVSHTINLIQHLLHPSPLTQGCTILRLGRVSQRPGLSE
jgi:hypothetical protein